jgi:uncharacterized protein
MFSGIGPTLAKSLVEYRGKKGLFKSREDLLKVVKFSKKAFEQAAGFLRIPGAKTRSTTREFTPRNYPKLETFATHLGKSGERSGWNWGQFSQISPEFKQQVGEFTYNDIITELEKPGRDPRDAFVTVHFNS